MPDFPFSGAQKITTLGATAGSSEGTSISNTTANTKGAWVALSTSTPHAAYEIFLLIGQGTSDSSYLVDVAVGAASSEQVILSNLLVSIGDGRNFSQGYIKFPVHIPQGSRLSVRMQSDNASDALVLMILLVAPSFLTETPTGRVETMGVATGDSGGTPIDAGAVQHTKGAYAQLVAATLYDFRYLAFGFGHAGNIAMSSGNFLFDIAIGATSSEQIIISNLYVATGSSYDVPTPQFMAGIPLYVPKGSRVSARSQSTVTGGQDRVIDLVIYGIE